MMRKTAAILLIVIPLTSSIHATDFNKPWHVQMSRHTLLEAWQRLKKLEIPGIATDSRFNITGASRFVSPNGDDANPGTEDKPWRTLQRRAQRSGPTWSST